MPFGQVVPQAARAEDRQAERDEHRDLREARERGVETVDLGLVGRVDVADQQADDEDREEARAVQRRGDAVHGCADGEDPDRVEALARQRDALHHRDQQPPPTTPTTRPDRHLDGDLARDAPGGALVRGRVLDHPDHQRDPDRVVRAGLALEDRPAPAADLAVAEHGEHHGRVGRGERRAEQPRA